MVSNFILGTHEGFKKISTYYYPESVIPFKETLEKASIAQTAVDSDNIIFFPDNNSLHVRIPYSQPANVNWKFEPTLLGREEEVIFKEALLNSIARSQELLGITPTKKRGNKKVDTWEVLQKKKELEELKQQEKINNFLSKTIVKALKL